TSWIDRRSVVTTADQASSSFFSKNPSKSVVSVALPIISLIFSEEEQPLNQLDTLPASTLIRIFGVRRCRFPFSSRHSRVCSLLLWSSGRYHLAVAGGSLLKQCTFASTDPPATASWY